MGKSGKLSFNGRKLAGNEQSGHFIYVYENLLALGGCLSLPQGYIHVYGRNVTYGRAKATANPVGGKACSSTKGGLLRYIHVPNTYSNHKVSSF